jgi:acylphosphatase
MMNPDITVLELRIEGLVQGVGYRAWAASEARKLGLTGWVRNRSDGMVEALVSGTTEAVEAFITACTRGPAGAQVANILRLPAKSPDKQSFEIKPTP